MLGKLRRDRSGGMALAAVAVTLAVVTVLAGVFVVYPYLTRADDYANDPGNTPEGCSGDPSWQGRLRMVVRLSVDRTGVTGVGTSSSGTRMTDWDDWEGDPWSVLSAASFVGPDVEYEVDYTVTMTRGAWIYEDRGGIEVEFGNHYIGNQKSRMFFFWSEQAGRWSWTLELECEGRRGTLSGAFTITEDGKLTQ